jgi:hypothetical protein
MPNWLADPRQRVSGAKAVFILRTGIPERSYRYRWR